jgi:hypothetical protein
MKYKTEAIDYTGCNPVIFKYLTNDEAVLCHVSDIDGEVARDEYVTAYHGTHTHPYATDRAYWKYATPVLTPETETRVKKASEIVEWMEDYNFEVDKEGNWVRKGYPSFVPEMFIYCGKVVNNNTWKWEARWLEEVEIDA